MIRSRKLLLGGAVIFAATFGAPQVNATDVDIDATLTASLTVNVVKNNDMDFGGIDHTTGHIGNVELGPDGNAALAAAPSPANLTLTGTPSAADMTVTISSGTVDVTCDNSAIISDGTTDLNITNVVWDTTQSTYSGAANTCAGLGTSPVQLTTTSTVYVGALLEITSNQLALASGSTPFDTSTGNGDPITFRFVFQ